ncbi:SusD/RagB family nutrient-binding outer membrane lipoprotein [Pedobacter miscanthi]|jgi:hypothetical protein|uniref:SusD/RagB family nutrient-binding outer membrane lipoprotein n=1 Tax=Pedobacter miscanthi TaxID=2259170 RepID=UPI00292FAF7F|nr:SusD/RagB family nutrient-binding outer membrane lipoprotein [Pedobacter miscanthi]
MKKIIYILSFMAIGILSSCTKDFEEINTNPAQFLTPDAEPVFSSTVKRTADLMGNNNVDFLWEYTHIINKSGRYNGGNDSYWQQTYVEVLGNLKQLRELYKNNPGYANRIQIINIWECYVYAMMVGTYGPVPYSAALEMTPSVRYDDENSIYTSLLARLKAASDAIVLTGDKFNPDILYGGDLTKWKKFANSFRLRLALTVRSNIPAAQETIKEVMANEAMLISADADNAKVVYSAAEGSESPYFIKLLKNVTNPDQMPKMSDYAMLYFRPYKDPRMQAYFEAVAPANQFVILDTLSSTADDTLRVVNYKIPYMGNAKSTFNIPTWNLPGLSPFNGANVNSYSNVQAPVLAAAHPFMLMDYAEVCFMKAEAKELGLGGLKTAEQYYLDGINANFTFWGLSNAAAAYTAGNGIKWNTEGKGYNNFWSLVNSDIPQNNMAKIWVQRWLNYYPDGAYEAWTLQRRTNNLKLVPHTNPASAVLNNPFQEIPDRWEYPVIAERNIEAYREALTILGSPQDSPEKALKFATPYVHRNWSLAQPVFDARFEQKWFGNTIQDLTAAGVSYTIVNKFVKI